LWSEIKIGVTILGGLLVAVAFLFGGFAGIVVALMGVGTIMFGDMLLLWKISNSDAKCLIEPNNPGEVIINLHLIGGGQRFLKGKQRPNGKIEFVYQRKEASIINTGKYSKRLPNGNSSVLAHESYDKTIDARHAKFMELASRECNDAKDVKEIYGWLDKQLSESETTEV